MGKSSADGSVSNKRLCFSDFKTGLLKPMQRLNLQVARQSAKCNWHLFEFCVGELLGHAAHDRVTTAHL
jgi:hypothetical protein